MRICIPVTPDGEVGSGFGRAAGVAIADVEAGTPGTWQEFDVHWDELHDTTTEGGHHARVARFLLDQQVRIVLAGHMGPGMQQMLERMGIDVRMGAAGDARQAVTLATSAEG